MADGPDTVDVGADLDRELTRIIQCPYPPSLSPLSHLLARANIAAIRASIQDRPPCAVSNLAKIVRDALPLTAYTLRVLHRLCHAPEFRDQLLIRYPGLLNGLLERAISSKQDFNELAELCVLLLSRPLPEAVPLPATAQNFLLHVFEKASQSPNANALKSVYRMLNGACGQLHRLLPSNTRRRFDTELCRILQNNVSGESAMLLLWLCGIVIIVEHPDGIQDLHLSSASEQPVSTQTLMQQWVTPSGQKLFGSTKDLYKNMQMTCLNVLWLLKARLEDDETTEGLRIASRIMQCIDKDIRDSWLMQDKNALLFDKCRSRIEETAASPSVQLEAFSFFGQLSGSRSVPQNMVGRYASCLFTGICTTDPGNVSELLSTSLPEFAAYIQDISALFSGILDACTLRMSPRYMSNLVSVVDTLTTAALSSATLRSNTLRSLSSKTVQDKIWQLVRLNLKDQTTGCCTHIASLQRQLIAATIASLINITLAAESRESSLPQPLTTALVKAQRDLPFVASACQYSSKPPKEAPISLFQAAGTQCAGQPLESWTTRLDSELESQGRYQRDAILRSVAQICSDLETRCSTAEEPLRREKEKSAGLEEQICSLSDKVESLRIENEDSADQLEGLEKELEDSREDQDRLRKENYAVTQDKERAWTRVKELEALLEESNQSASEALSAAQESFNAKELALQSTIARHEEDIRTHDLQTKQLHGTINDLRQSQVQWEKNHSTLTEEYELLQRRCKEMEETLQHVRADASHQNDDVARLQVQVSEYCRRLEEKEAELEDTIRKLETLHTTYQELQETSEAKAKDLANKHASDIESLTLQAEEDCRALEDQLQSVLQDHERERDSHEETRDRLQQLQHAIPPLESRIQELEDFCKEQEEELEERRAIHKNILANFGVSSQQPLAIRSASRSYKDIAEPTVREPRTRRRRKSNFIAAQDDTPKATMSVPSMKTSTTESTANISFESSSSQTSVPAPKRSKPRPTFKVPTMHTPYTQKPSLVSKSVLNRTSPSKRSALRQVSPNRRHTVGITPADQDNDCTTESALPVDKRRGSLQEDIEYGDFDTDEEEFLSGTPLTPGFMAGTGRVPDEDESMSEL
ncbi:uncharacterized protein yc1106_09880 [Curvularia clavata]|uniref:Uncharacterized protein n=1 Tax=Curvularia clavata TaxID=95742 RepID=A0A9Q8ZIE8_CURCL|nr:uncharacterized protein yc1106_09880 [Curvularia clavata]